VRKSPKVVFSGHGDPGAKARKPGVYCVNLKSAQDEASRPIYVMFTQQLRPVLIVLSYH
jgi:hypothetical protein